MKKFLIAGILSIMACSANAASLYSENAALPAQTETSVIMQDKEYAKKPKIVIRGDRVVIIYSDGQTVVVDKNGKVVYVP